MGGIGREEYLRIKTPVLTGIATSLIEKLLKLYRMIKENQPYLVHFFNPKPIILGGFLSRLFLYDFC